MTLCSANKVPIEAGAIYAFDKVYCNYAWWTRIHQAPASFVTRPKTNVAFRVICRRKLEQSQADGFTVLGDAEVKLASQGRANLAMALRRIRLRRNNGGVLTIFTNDLVRFAVEIAAFYKARWQIKLLFRWIKQHLKLKKFLARSENGVRRQVIAAMMPLDYARHPVRRTHYRCLFTRKPIAKIDKPPDVHGAKRDPLLTRIN